MSVRRRKGRAAAVNSYSSYGFALFIACCIIGTSALSADHTGGSISGHDARNVTLAADPSRTDVASEEHFERQSELLATNNRLPVTETVKKIRELGIAPTIAYPRQPAVAEADSNGDLVPPLPLAVMSLTTGLNGVANGAGQTSRPSVEQVPSSEFPLDALFSLKSGVNPGLTTAVLTQVPGQVGGVDPVSALALLGDPKNLADKLVEGRRPLQNTRFQTALYEMVRKVQRLRPKNPYLKLLPTPPRHGGASKGIQQAVTELDSTLLAAAGGNSGILGGSLPPPLPQKSPIALLNGLNSGNSPGNTEPPITSGFRALTLMEILRLLGFGGPSLHNPIGASPVAPFVQLYGDSVIPSLPKAAAFFQAYKPGYNTLAAPTAVRWMAEEASDFKLAGQIFGSTSYYDSEGS